MKLAARVELILVVLVLSAYAAGVVCADEIWDSRYNFIPLQGCCNGKTVSYLITDASDQAYAGAFGVNYTPLLGQALSPTVNGASFMPGVYYVANHPQSLVFSAEWPASHPAKPGDYMPFWILHEVTWINEKNAVDLTSLSDIIAAYGAGKVRLKKLDVVIGASIIINSKGNAIKQAYVWKKPDYKLVRLPVKALFINGQIYQMLQLDFSNKSNAGLYGGTYAPLLSRLFPLKLQGEQGPWQNIYCFWPWPPAGQLFVSREIPMPFGPGNSNPRYSPLMNEWRVRAGGPSPLYVYNSYAAIQAAMLPRWGTAYLSYQPIVGQP